MGIIIISLFTLGIGGSMATGFWATASEKTPAKFQSAELSDVNNPADIRGSYTFEEVADLFDIELQVLYKAFGIPSDTDGSVFKVKELEGIYGEAGVEIGTGSLRIFVALYKNLPIDLDGSYLPEAGSLILTQENRDLSEEQKTYLETHTLNN